MKKNALHTLIIRADADIAIGTGHVIRCLALAQSWQDQGGRALFAMAHSTPALEAWLKYEGMDQVIMEVIPGADTDVMRLIEIAREQGAEWVVVDGYQFDKKFQLSI